LRLKGDYAVAAVPIGMRWRCVRTTPVARDPAARLLETEIATAPKPPRAIVRGRPDMLGRATYTLTAASHGRCFFYLNVARSFSGPKAV
jgi:hypothetical protein